MTTILIILAAIAVVWVCLTCSANENEHCDEYEHRSRNDSNWNLHSYDYPDAAPWEIVEGDENFSMAEDLEPGGSTHELNRQIEEMYESE